MQQVHSVASAALLEADMSIVTDMSAVGRFCCRKLLKVVGVGDSVAVMRFATGADHDGAADSRPGTVFLFISSR